MSADVTMFLAAAGKDAAVTAVLLQGKAKLLYEQLFPNATTPFSSCTGLGSQFTTSNICSTEPEITVGHRTFSEHL